MLDALAPHIAARAFQRPLMIEPAKMEEIRAWLVPRVYGAAPAPSAGVADDSLGREYDTWECSTYSTVDGVAIIDVAGVLIHKGAWIGRSSGQTSYQGLQAQIMRATADPSVRGVAFEFDSPGGEVMGAFETAAMIARLSAVKPTLAIVASQADSAGYLLASQCRQIIAPEQASIGSIGVLMVHIDQSSALDKAGLGVTFIHAGARKVDGNSAMALPEDVANRFQAAVDKTRIQFAEAVVRGRPDLDLAAVLATEADSYDGEDAVSRGLADAIGHPTDAFDAFVEAVNSGQPA